MVERETAGCWPPRRVHTRVMPSTNPHLAQKLLLALATLLAPAWAEDAAKEPNKPATPVGLVEVMAVDAIGDRSVVALKRFVEVPGDEGRRMEH